MQVPIELHERLVRNMNNGALSQVMLTSHAYRALARQELIRRGRIAQIMKTITRAHIPDLLSWSPVFLSLIRHETARRLWKLIRYVQRKVPAFDDLKDISLTLYSRSRAKSVEVTFWRDGSLGIVDWAHDHRRGTQFADSHHPFQKGVALQLMSSALSEDTKVSMVAEFETDNQDSDSEGSFDIGAHCQSHHESAEILQCVVQAGINVQDLLVDVTFHAYSNMFGDGLDILE